MKTVELKVTGMNCVHCEAGVAKALEKVDGVEKAVADHDNDRVLVRLTNDDLDLSLLKAAVEADPDKGWKVED
jgi:copper chaperone CopZ